MNNFSIELTKILGFTFLAAILALVIAIELLYYKGLATLPDDPYPKSNGYSRFLLDSKWVALGGTGDIKMRGVSPITFVVRVVYAGAAGSRDLQMKVMHESQGLVGVISRILFFKNYERLKGASTLTKQLGQISTSIWISNHWNAQNGLNYVLENEYSGRSCWGIQAAAKNYFGKTLNHLSNQEALFLVGISKNPSNFDPAVNPKESLEWANQIADRLAKNWPDRYGNLQKMKKIPATLVKPVRRCMPAKAIG